jgi:hypothetical protein
MPRGDLTFAFAVRSEDAERAEVALREAGFSQLGREEARPPDDPSSHVLVTALWEAGGRDFDGDEQQAIHQKAEGAFREHGIEFRLSSSGVVVSGGTPEHRWVEVTVDGRPQNLKIVAANDREADEQLDQLARDRGIERDRLNIIPPPGWAGYGIPDDVA